MNQRTPIPTDQRLIFALDVPDIDQARGLIRTLGEHVQFYKLGLEFFLSGHYFALADELKAAGKRVFADLKLFDIPPTVGRATAQLARREVDFLTVHGNDAMLEAAVAHRGDMGILAVTALTSLDQGDLNDLGFQCDIEQLVRSRARRAFELGCTGVISSGLEVPALRRDVDHRLVVVCPGIRPVANIDEQKRTLSVPEAFEAGADHIVVGRPIRDASDPAAAAAEIQQQIAAHFDT
ncbi:orotidine-5'-phosphate decarboxylase [Wenzhouxiangella sp. AB-CW3]|uniref:orotidine-5'-phosphate decarboxylase n=1 Tax=Wenzhouxiangella sp. AB-CW3 TaxID=2771012 RepID=UPI00168B40D7|nr:orotidine-5'-phosphate decarboxylase [Wenzhouxiangella sp. AB-CW3]QOC22689.1 orotidine-5'-phosphate decarboxylase [Wenzhouxiangella sp. AB-CW3]